MYKPDLETMDRDKLEKLQLSRLQDTVSRIAEKNSRYYERLGKVPPQEIKSLKDLVKLPFLTKADLRDAYPYQLVCVDQSEFLRMQMSSGTTGAPVICPYTRADIEQWKDIMGRCYMAATLTSQDVIQITPSFGLPNGGFGFHYGAEAIGAFYIPIGAGRTLLQLQLMKDLRATVLTAISTYPLRLIEAAREEGVDFRETSLRVGVFGSEMWSDELRKRIEEGMGIETFDIIGMTETGGVGMGIDCEAHNGIHIWEDHYIVEIIDPETGQVLEDGQEGEMVITTLTREALPTIRYRTGDITSVVSREKCDCGRTHIRVDRFKGRADDMLIYKGVNFYPSQVEKALLKFDEVAHDYQIILDRDEGGSETIRLIVEVTSPLSEQQIARMKRELVDFVGLTVDPEFVKAGELPRPPGKAIRVIDNR
jgi:phenylacetate-CoA ligase